MTQPQLLTPMPLALPSADRCCDRLPCFQARLEATAGLRQMRVTTELCARHLGAAVKDLVAWAQDEAMHGQLTLIVIGQPAPPRRAASPGRTGGPFPTGFAFSTIQLDP